MSFEPASTDQSRSFPPDVLLVLAVIVGLLASLWMSGALSWTPRAQELTGLGTTTTTSTTETPAFGTGTGLIHELEDCDLAALDAEIKALERAREEAKHDSTQ